MPNGIYDRTNIKRGGWKLSKETCHKMSVSQTGRKHPNYKHARVWFGKKMSAEHRHKLSMAHLGKKTWNYKENLIKCNFCSKLFHKKPSHLTKRNFCSQLCFDNWRREFDIESKDRLRALAKLNDRGLTPLHNRIRHSDKYRLWRRTVFIRDEFTCQKCGRYHTYIVAHHIKPFSQYSELRLDINNGITLCDDCHRQTDSYGNNKLKGALQCSKD